MIYLHLEPFSCLVGATVSQDTRTIISHCNSIEMTFRDLLVSGILEKRFQPYQEDIDSGPDTQ